jgi:hypothetical protein
MELVHEAVIEGGKVFEAIRTGFFESLEKEDLCSRVELFEQMAQLRHCIATGWDTENIVDKTFHELLGDIFADKIAFREFSRSEQLIERDSLRCKRNRLLLMGVHAGDTPGFGMGARTLKQLY